MGRIEREKGNRDRKEKWRDGGQKEELLDAGLADDNNINANALSGRDTSERKRDSVSTENLVPFKH